MLLSIPIILASLLLSLINFFYSGGQTFNLQLPIFAAMIAFITALLSINFMMKIIKVSNFNIFIIYRILLGIILLSLYA